GRQRPATRRLGQRDRPSNAPKTAKLLWRSTPHPEDERGGLEQLLWCLVEGSAGECTHGGVAGGVDNDAGLNAASCTALRHFQAGGPVLLAGQRRRHGLGAEPAVK